MNSLTKTINDAAAGALILTANKRLARYLSLAFDRTMQEEGRAAWPTPQIISLDGWLARCLAEVGEDWRLLGGTASLRLWESLIETHTTANDLELLQLSATARRAQAAYQLMVSYNCQGHDHPLTQDQQIFHEWVLEYQRLCRDNRWLDRAEVPGVVLEAIRTGKLTLPRTILACGFDQTPPGLNTLRSLHQDTGGRFLSVQLGREMVGEVARVVCPDPTQEIEQAARWARHLLDRGATSIGVVVLDLKERRSLVERIFRDQVEPESALQQHDGDPSFSLSLGAPLLEQGVAHAGLEILSTGARLTMEQASFLLRTPYLSASVREADARAVMDARLRSFRQKDLVLKQLIKIAEEGGDTPAAAKIFATLLESTSEGGKKLPGEWATLFDQTLLTVGWPGEQSLSSREYQVVKSWREKLLPALASLDQVSSPMPRRQALGLLRRLAGEIEFQPKSETGPIQVLGLLESAGLEFEHLWVAGAGEVNLPAKAQPNPFLPTSLQVAHGMAHSGPVRELEFARNVVTRLKLAAPQVIFSSPGRFGDSELRPSPLLADLGETVPVLAPPQDACSRQTAIPTTLDSVDDTQGPRLAGERASGGTSVLKDQALCPFRAFAHSRLQARGFEPAKAGLDPRTRGDLLHKTLELLWGELKDQKSLLALTPAGLRSLVVTQVQGTIAAYFAERAAPAEKILEIEAHRLEELVYEWLSEVEAARPAFRVEAMEQAHVIQIGELQIKTLIDRVDLLEGGEQVILDYKTGLMGLDDLLAERLLEPQLPIYTTTQAADAVAFAQVRKGDSKFIGAARNEELLPKVAAVESLKKAAGLGVTTWGDLMVFWRNQLEALASDFVAGKATVDPVDPVTACQYCDLSGLCRVAESQFLEEGVVNQ